jgi:protein involved in polysaccharide export with SLBB domain
MTCLVGNSSRVRMIAAVDPPRVSVPQPPAHGKNFERAAAASRDSDRSTRSGPPRWWEWVILITITDSVLRRAMSSIRRFCRQPLWLSLLVIAVSSCMWRDPRTGPLRNSITPAPISVGPYRIQAGDELEIRFFDTPEHNVVLPVRPDGFISLPLAYEMLAAGRTVEELRRELVERVSRQLVDPEIAIIVRTFTGYVVHVGGEVRRPGVLQFTGSRTVLEAVFEAGGFLPTASEADVMVVRRLEAGGFEVLDANLYEVLTGEDGSGNFALQPFDVVFVPPTAIAEVNQFVEQYIRLNIPVNFSYRIGDGD